MNPEQQIETYSKRIQEHPASLVFLPLAELLRQKGSIVEAIQVCRGGLRHHASLSKAKLFLGELLYQQEHFAEARQWFKSVLIDYPDHEVAKQYLNLIAERGTFDLPVTPLTPVAPDHRESSPKTVPAPIRSLSTEVEELPPVESSGPDQEFKTPTMAELYVRQGFTSDAIALYRSIVKEQPQNESARNRLAELEQQQGGVGGASSSSPDLKQRLTVVKNTLQELSTQISALESLLK